MTEQETKIADELLNDISAAMKYDRSDKGSCGKEIYAAIQRYESFLRAIELRQNNEYLEKRRLEKDSKPKTLRGSGRTTRMLKEAEISAQKEGQTVCVIFPTEQMARIVRAQNPVLKELGAGFFTPESFKSFCGVSLDQALISPPHGSTFHSLSIYVDHSVIESEYGHLLKELHRYDFPEES